MIFIFSIIFDEQVKVRQNVDLRFSSVNCPIFSFFFVFFIFFKVILVSSEECSCVESSLNKFIK